MVSAMSKLHSKAAADELGEMLSDGWIAAGIPPTELENPILKKATELVARKARTTHVHTTVARCSHSHTCSQANTLAFICMKIFGAIGQGPTVQGGWTPPSRNAVLDDHLRKLYAATKSRLQRYEAALAERRRKAALLSDGKKMENGCPCVAIGTIGICTRFFALAVSPYHYLTAYCSWSHAGHVLVSYVPVPSASPDGELK